MVASSQEGTRLPANHFQRGASGSADSQNKPGTGLPDSHSANLNLEIAVEKSTNFDRNLQKPIDEAAAQQISKQFVEVLMAPSFTHAALEVFKSKVNVRILQIDLPRGGQSNWDQGRNAMEMKRVSSGILLQTADNHELTLADLKVVTTKQPTQDELSDLLFATVPSPTCAWPFVNTSNAASLPMALPAPGVMTADTTTSWPILAKAVGSAPRATPGS